MEKGFFFFRETKLFFYIIIACENNSSCVLHLLPSAARYYPFPSDYICMQKGKDDDPAIIRFVDNYVFFYVSIGCVTASSFLLIVGVVLMVAASVSAKKKKGKKLGPDYMVFE
jgi:hypothetical protein